MKQYLEAQFRNKSVHLYWELSRCTFNDLFFTISASIELYSLKDSVIVEKRRSEKLFLDTGSVNFMYFI